MTVQATHLYSLRANKVRCVLFSILSSAFIYYSDNICSFKYGSVLQLAANFQLNFTNGENILNLFPAEPGYGNLLLFVDIEGLTLYFTLKKNAVGVNISFSFHI
jgi:hypothetical protein